MEEIVRNICMYLVENIDRNVSIEELESVFNYNKFYLIRFFKEYTGLTTKEYVNSVKAYKSINPLINTDDKILKIALDNGFNSQEYYSEIFKKIVGTSPIKFRKEYSDLSIYKDQDELIEKKNTLERLDNNYNRLIGNDNYKYIDDDYSYEYKKTA